MDTEKVDSLVVFLSNPNRKAEEHVATVMDMTRRLARYEKELNDSRDENAKMRATNAAQWNQEYPGQFGPARRYDEPNILQLPQGTRSVEIKL